MILINASSRNALKIFQPFLPIFVPIGLGCLAAACEQAGIEATYIDQQVEEDVLGRIAQGLEGRPGPHIIGFSVLTSAVKPAMELSAMVRELYPEAVIVFGGIHPTAMPEEMLALPQVDIVVRGEGERVMVELYRRIKSGRSWADLPGISYRSLGTVVHNPANCELIDLESLPPFPYHLFEDSRYDLGFLISSRGCPYNCIFCSNRITTGKKYRHISNASVVETLEMLHSRYNRTFVLFLDDNFLVDKKRAYDLMERIRARGLHQKMTFSFQARGDNVDAPLLKALYESGFRSVFFGLETASERLMRTVKKGETVAQCVQAVHLAKAAGLHVSATFIFALPGETHVDRMDAVRLARQLGLDQVRFNNATPYPGTELYDMARDEGRLNVVGSYENFLSVGVFIESPFDPIPFSYVPAGSTEPEIRNDILFAYLALYWDFRRLREILFKPKQGAGWFSAGHDAWAFLKKIPPLCMLFALLSAKFLGMICSVLAGRNARIGRGQLLKVLLGRGV